MPTATVGFNIIDSEEAFFFFLYWEMEDLSPSSPIAAPSASTSWYLGVYKAGPRTKER